MESDVSHFASVKNFGWNVMAPRSGGQASSSGGRSTVRTTSTGEMPSGTCWCGVHPPWRVPQSVGQLGGHAGFRGCFHNGIPLFSFGPKDSVECPGAGLKHEVGT